MKTRIRIVDQSGNDIGLWLIEATVVYSVVVAAKNLEEAKRAVKIQAEYGDLAIDTIKHKITHLKSLKDVPEEWRKLPLFGYPGENEDGSYKTAEELFSGITKEAK